MFKDRIPQTSFTTEIANEYFKEKIYGYGWQDDMSFLTTLRVLLGNKINEDDYLKINHLSANLRRNPAGSVTNEFMKYDIAPYENTLTIMNYYGTSGTDLDIDSIKNAMIAYPQFCELENVEILFKKNFKVTCYINEEKKSAVIHILDLDLKKYHLLQCAILGILPWYADKDGISEEDRELLYSLREKTPDKYLNLIEEKAKEYNFKELFIRKKLHGIEAAGERRMLQQLKITIDQVQRDIRSYMERISEKITNLRDYQTRVMGLEIKLNSSDSEESELMKYFLVNSKLGLSTVYDGELTYTVKDYIRYFDETQAKKYIENKASYFYKYCGKQTPVGVLSKEEVQRVMTAIFIDQELKIKACSAYRMDLTRNTVRAVGGFEYSTEFDRCMPNPHIDAYECVGNYLQVFAEAFIEGNYIGVIENTISSAISLNLADAPVMDKFMYYIFGFENSNTPTNREKCIELPNGMSVNIKDAAEWLKENENE